MEDLIKALQIFLKYKNSSSPIQCGRDTLNIKDIGFVEISQDDKTELCELGFEWDDEFDVWTTST